MLDGRSGRYHNKNSPSSYRMGFSFVVSWTKEKLLGVTWEIQSVWNDINFVKLGL